MFVGVEIEFSIVDIEDGSEKYDRQLRDYLIVEGNEKFNSEGIVFVKEYYYSNGVKGKNHFFVIIDQNNIAVPIENFGMLISSKLTKLKYPANKLLEKNNKNNLNMDSIVKTDVIYKILNNQILFKIGKVDTTKIEEYKNSFIENNKEN